MTQLYVVKELFISKHYQSEYTLRKNLLSLEFYYPQYAPAPFLRGGGGKTLKAYSKQCINDKMYSCFVVIA